MGRGEGYVADRLARFGLDEQHVVLAPEPDFTRQNLVLSVKLAH